MKIEILPGSPADADVPPSTSPSTKSPFERLQKLSTVPSQDELVLLSSLAQSEAAATIQSLIRRRQARRLYLGSMNKESLSALHNSSSTSSLKAIAEGVACSVIQSLWRGSSARHGIKEDREDILRNDAMEGENERDEKREGGVGGIIEDDRNEEAIGDDDGDGNVDADVDDAKESALSHAAVSTYPAAAAAMERQQEQPQQLQQPSSPPTAPAPAPVPAPAIPTFPPHMHHATPFSQVVLLAHKQAFEAQKKKPVTMHCTEIVKILQALNVVKGKVSCA